MDFSWSEEQTQFRRAVVDFARRELSADPTKADRESEFPRDLWRACAAFGIHGLPFPEAVGGLDKDVLTTMLAMEALGAVCPDRGFLFSIHAHMWSVAMPIHSFGSEQQRARFLPGLCDGSLIGAHAMSEPDTGSDAFGLTTRAERKGDRYILTGTKTFCTNAPVGDLFVVFATVDRKRGSLGVTAFLVEKGTPGLSVGAPISKMGLRTSPMAEVILEDCEVPADNVLGREGMGASVFNHSMGWERSCILATDVGAMERQLDACIAYAKERYQFGKPIGSFQLVASRVTDMKLRLETARLLLYRTAWSQSRGEMTGLEAAMTKLYISEAAVASGLDAIQLHGGYGYTTEFGIERDLRDAIGGRLYSGTSEIQRLLVAHHLGLRQRN
jgi:alkylation response protein AidB-like acyl-CoA dehydrogenase